MIKITTIAKCIVIFLAISVQTASAAMINLQQAYDDLLATYPEGTCTLGITESGCPIPDAESDVEVMIDGFITLTSPGNAAFLEDTDLGTFIVFLADTPQAEVVVDFAFDETQVTVFNLLFEAAPADSLTCTVVSPGDCSSDMSPFLITGFGSITALQLSSLEGFAHNFAYNVPVPAALLLFLSGLAGLAGLAGRKPRTGLPVVNTTSH